MNFKEEEAIAFNYENASINSYQKVKELMETRVIHSAKIRLSITHNDNIVRNTLNDLFKYISAFNNLEECSDRIFDSNLSSYKIINELVPFVYPDSVRWDPKDRRTADLLVRNCSESIDSGSPNEFHDLEAEFRRWFRKDLGSEFVTLDQLRVPKSFADVESYMMLNRCIGTTTPEENLETGVYEWQVKVDNSPFIAVPLDNSKVGGLYLDRYFNSSYLENLKDYFAPLSF